jgi:hypothetical protein
VNRSKRLAERLTAQVAKARFLATLRNPHDVVPAHPFHVRLTVSLGHGEPPSVYLERFTPGRLSMAPGTVKLFKSPRQSRGFPFSVMAQSGIAEIGNGLEKNINTMNCANLTLD